MRYTGQVKNKIPHGFGTLELDNGDVYVGGFSENKFNGSGTYTFKNGNKYIGGFKNHSFHDEGKIIFSSGKSIAGKFYNGKLLGAMKLESQNNICNGYAFDGNFEGEIKYENKNHTLFYEGVVKDQKLHGSGRLDVVSDIKGKMEKCTFDGRWKEGKRTGNGTLECSNGVRYAGCWLENKFQGKGFLVLSNGNFYEGFFANDKFSGKGKFTSNGGSEIQNSNWCNNKPYGLVKILISSGNEYIGNLLDGKPEGKGIMQYKNWFLYDGYWKNGVFEGKGQLYFPNGHVLIGVFQAGKPYGECSLYANIWGFHREAVLLPSASAAASLSSSSSSSSLSSLVNIIPVPGASSSLSPIFYDIVVKGQWEGLKGRGRLECRGSESNTEFAKEQKRADVERKERKKVVKASNGKCGKEKEERQTREGDGLYETMVDLLYAPLPNAEVLLTEKGHVVYIKKEKKPKKVKMHKMKQKEEGEEEEDEDHDEEENEEDRSMYGRKEKKNNNVLGKCLDNIGVLNDEGFSEEKRIGSGGFGEVYVAKYFGSTVAYKILTQNLTRDAVEDFKREVITLNRLRHPNVIIFMGYTPLPKLRIVMEYASSGSLHDLIHNTPAYAQGVPPRVFLDAALQVASGMAYLSSQRIIHKDLKPMNVLIETNTLGDRTYKIADFGLAKLCQHEETFVLNKGSPQYSPPEAFGDGRCTDRLDVYSYGMMLWEMWAHEVPFKGLSFTQMLGAIFRKERPNMPVVPANMPYLAEYAALIKACWQEEASKRPAFTEVLVTLTHIVEAEQTWSEKERK